jgi:hypothetical protein
LADTRTRRTPRRPIARRLAEILLAIVLIALLAMRQAGSDVAPPTPAPKVGFSFSPYAVAPGIDPLAGFAELLARLDPDVVRLPVYWKDVMPAPGVIDFSQPDTLMAEVAAHNQAVPARPTQVVLVLGVRNIDYPEVWAPTWVPPERLANLSRVVASPDYTAYFDAAVAHYAGDPLVSTWQIENEPFDDVASGVSPADVSLTRAAIASETKRLRRIDTTRPIMITTYDSATVQLDKQATSDLSWLYRLLPGPKPVGHPTTVLADADILGMDAYVVTPSTPLDEATAQIRMGWKAQALDYWATEAQRLDKPMWITEMQAAPWGGTPGFTPADLMQSAHLYANVGAAVTLLWGVESWLGSESWLQAGAEAVQIMRTSGHPREEVA